MKLLSYNIWNGGPERIPLILKVIKEQSPDFLAIQEANTFFDNDNKILKQFSLELNLPYYDISRSNENYHVASFSKIPFKKVNKLPNFRNACLETITETDLGELSICNTHLHPFFEEKALVEIKKVIEVQRNHKNNIILGDLNSLSPEDNYSISIIDQLNEVLSKKFTDKGKIRYKVISSLLSNNYIDVAVQLQKNKINTVPTKINFDPAHMALLRLDDIFVSELLASRLKSFDVIKSEDSDQASDHFPVTATLQ
ncbi:hypothetical protein A3G67_01605 [Candidatus Roizmanbacteria bacterium RIFCSPLOWO2_12_FULL_40_12]|uniref:Endonuclease/exonuclease/phosphatase domain-containing protein n=1 Tax=Candidatus Roizmanbacteria bacterium RIFCSPLOWO2_01_FULL_40_42 TaxID=1802066 RepID=A0A1F7J311_9BACT|nr:MAG: hypothetical protein A2779_03735 [Candidatus Roizmanbacteria bacterium RIFCSPHIGHO2_01_FULL_40_98]OGK28445.1 MAG: hypothetical protein A3C31_02540 [Candidatus Roizmanbacteria bacterium RIFCSPHIGHO2_02_FULL_40_53]OGK30356.1 MAG: hypothetical protein A2W49_01200 [Candidatus Roizmanbacteria bacterium RIFCSPHIGHO2_12_41_18]OGK36239.1 MAG: hypothetical protein A3E69_04440 [Candidatus Roizmanbacteria bacterium RIFCSPHIGHO2_12_FULL_40_130]OGK49994.1 MAG: hypothetical protein A3B50_03115 [Candi